MTRLANHPASPPLLRPLRTRPEAAFDTARTALNHIARYGDSLSREIADEALARIAELMEDR